MRRLIQSVSQISLEPNSLFHKVNKTDNKWRSLQLERAQEIFPDINFEEYTENEILQKYSKYVIEKLTPKADLDSTNCIAQLRDLPFDLDRAYEKAEKKGKAYLAKTLKDYRENPIPNLEIIQEMVNLGKNKKSKKSKVE